MISPKGLLFLYFLIAIPGNNGNAGDESNNSDFAEGNDHINSSAVETPTITDESTNSETVTKGNERPLNDAEKQMLDNYKTCAIDLEAANLRFKVGISNYAFAHRDDINSSAGEKPTIPDESTKSETGPGNDHINSSAGEKPTIPDESTESETGPRNDHINSSAGEKPTIPDESTKSETVKKDCENYRLYLDSEVERYQGLGVEFFDDVSVWCSKQSYSDDLVEVCTTKLREIFHDRIIPINSSAEEKPTIPDESTKSETDPRNDHINSSAGEKPTITDESTKSKSVPSTGLQNFVRVFNEFFDLMIGGKSDSELQEMIADPSDVTAQDPEVPRDDVKLYKGYLLIESEKMNYIQNTDSWCKEKYIFNPVV